MAKAVAAERRRCFDAARVRADHKPPDAKDAKIQEKLFRLLLSRPWRILGESLASFASGCLYFRPLPMKNFCLQRLSSKRWQLFKP
ncbi:hypothetical protein [Ottowia sp.]|uniref:hypothetical protein n=1 Tax=Ottowia sp. TaxID=1898956 RepID=UPI002D1FAD63|nr:hypothetical protein [Ottowia sp.]